MNITNLIETKRDGGELSAAQIEWFARACTEVPLHAPATVR